MKLLLIKLLSFSCVILITGIICVQIWKKQPVPKKKTFLKFIPTVGIITARPESIKTYIHTQGVLETISPTNISTGISGKILSVSKNFRTSGKFNQGEIIAIIDDSDYRTIISQAEANLNKAKIALQIEESKAAQIMRDWKRLSLEGNPLDIALRVPQMSTSKATIKIAEAELIRAKNNLKKTEIRAPYNCRVAKIHSNVGNFISIGMPIATVYSTSTYKIKLPISLEQKNHIDTYKADKNLIATLSSNIFGEKIEWISKIIDGESIVDRSTRSVNLTAVIELDNTNKNILLPGMYLDAEIEGKTLKDVYKVPLTALTKNNRIIIIDDYLKLLFIDIIKVWSKGESIYITKGLNSGDKLCLNAKESYLQGMRVNMIDISNSQMNRNSL